MDLEIYIRATSVCNAEPKRTVLQQTGIEALCEIWRNFTEPVKTEQEVTSSEMSKRDVYQVTVYLFDKHFGLKENIPKAHTIFKKMEPNTGRTVKNYIIHLKVLVKP